MRGCVVRTNGISQRRKTDEERGRYSEGSSQRRWSSLGRMGILRMARSATSPIWNRRRKDMTKKTGRRYIWIIGTRGWAPSRNTCRTRRRTIWTWDENDKHQGMYRSIWIGTTGDPSHRTLNVRRVAIRRVRGNYDVSDEGACGKMADDQWIDIASPTYGFIWESTIRRISWRDRMMNRKIIRADSANQMIAHILPIVKYEMSSEWMSLSCSSRLRRRSRRENDYQVYYIAL